MIVNEVVSHLAVPVGLAAESYVHSSINVLDRLFTRVSFVAEERLCHTILAPCHNMETLADMILVRQGV